MSEERTPRLAVGHLPSLCDLGPRLLTLTGLLRVWLINHFNSSDNIELLKLRKCVWNKDPAKSGIVIEKNTAWDPRKTGTRPALILKRGAWRRIRLGIGDKFLGGGSSQNGDEHYCNWWQGSHTVFAIAGEDGECEMLATEVFRELNEFGPAVRDMLGLKRFEVAEVAEIAILEEASQNFVVPVNIAYAVEESWILRQEAPFLKRIDVSLLGL